MDDRATILRRRAFFVTSALAAVGCAPTPAPNTPGGSSSSDTSAVTVPSAVPAPGDASDGAAPPPREPVSEPLPNMEIPAGVSDTARSRYEQLFKRMKEAHATLASVEKTVPDGCSPAEPKCAAAWRSVAEALQGLDVGFSKFLVCGGTSAEAKAFEARAEEHQKFLTERRQKLDERIAKAVAAGGQRAGSEWQRIKDDAENANPRPCLKFGCPDW